MPSPAVPARPRVPPALPSRPRRAPGSGARRRTPLGRALLAAGSGALAAAGGPLLARPARAQQLEASVDLGGVMLRYADSLRAAAITVAPAARLNAGRASLGAYGTGSRLDVGDWSVQGGIDGAVATPTWRRRLLGDLTGIAAGSAHRDGTRTGDLRALGRVHLLGWRGGLWAGGGVGRTHDGVRDRDIRLVTTGVWATLGRSVVSLTATPTTVDDTLHYTDGEAAVLVALGRADLSLSAGARAGENVLVNVGGDRVWGGAGLTWCLASRVGVVAAAGTYPVSPTQGFPGGRYATLAVRLATRARRSAAAEPAAVVEPAASGITGFRTVAAGGGKHTVHVRATTARALEVTGDFTGWQPVALRRGSDGWWTVTLPIEAGVHQMNVRLDGGPWTVPPGLPSVSDEFGGRVGLLVIE